MAGITGKVGMSRVARELKAGRTMAGPYAKIGAARGGAQRGSGPDCYPSAPAPGTGAATRGQRRR